MQTSPGIGLQIFCSGDSIQKVELSLEPSFTWAIHSASASLERAILLWLERYAQKDPIPLPDLFQMSFLSSFQKKVLDRMKQIPFGETRSYKELAEMCGKPKGARAIGGGCHRNPFPLFYPCHRVISGNGSLGGFALDLEIKKKLLNFEGKFLSPS